MSKFKYQYGRLSYLNKSTGLEHGREDWWLTRNRDGTTTMRCLAMTDDSKHVRDAALTRTKEGRPTDGFVRLMVEKQLMGTGYFRVEGDKLHVVADGPGTGHCLQTVKVPGGPFSLVLHAIMLNGWMIFGYDRATGGEQECPIYNTAPRPDCLGGPLGPMGLIMKLETCRINLLGEEEVIVPAGTFKASHFTVNSDFSNLPPPHLWVAGEDRILLRCEGAEFDHQYVLTSWKTEQR